MNQTTQLSDTPPNTDPDSTRGHKIAVIILNYRKALLTVQCANRIASENAASIIYIVDNSASHDYSNSLNIEIQKFYCQTTPLHIITPNTNLGFAAGVNIAILTDKRMHDAYLLINNDALPEASMISILADQLFLTPRLAAVSPQIISSGNLSAKIWYHQITGILSTHRMPGSFPFLSGACILVRQSVLTNNNTLFDERFFMYGEDAELGWRLHQSSFSVATVDNALCHHIGSASARNGSYFYEYHTARWHILMAEILADSAISRAGLLVVRAFVLMTRASIRSFRLRNITPLRALWAAWHHRSSPAMQGPHP